MTCEGISIRRTHSFRVVTTVSLEVAALTPIVYIVRVGVQVILYHSLTPLPSASIIFIFHFFILLDVRVKIHGVDPWNDIYLPSISRNPTCPRYHDRDDPSEIGGSLALIFAAIWAAIRRLLISLGPLLAR